MQRIVIVGAGYGGLITALNLEKNLQNNSNISITLVDQHAYHLFTTNLYEIASAEEEFTSIADLKKSIAIPYADVLAGKKITFVQAKVTSVDQLQKKIFSEHKTIEFDYLVLGCGSESDYFNIEGAQKYALPMKSLKDALTIRNKLEFAVQLHRSDVNKKNLRIVVAGGGYTGIEFTGELAGLMDIIAWKNQYPREKIEITIVEATNQLVPGFSDRMSRDAYVRLNELGIRIQLSSPIFNVDDHFVQLVGGEKMEYDVLVWTAGVKARPLPFMQPAGVDRKGRAVTTSCLQLEKNNHIFILGDQASVTNVDSKPAPPTAQDAIAQADYLGYAIPLVMENKKPEPYRGQKHGFIITIGGSWAIVNYGGFYFKGFFAYFVRQMVDVRYLHRLIGWIKAISYVWFETKVYSRNK